MPDLRLYIPKALVFQRLIKSAIGAANQIDQGTDINDAHAFALLEFFEFLAPEQLTSIMGPGLTAEISAIIENEFSWTLLGERTPVQNLLCTHACAFAGIFCCDGDEEPKCCRTWLRFQERNPALYPREREKSLAANFEIAMGLDPNAQAINSKVQLLKYRIAARTAEALLAIGFDPEMTLRHIRQEHIPSPTEILAMQVFVLLKKSSEDLARVCNWTNADSETTFLHWASTDPFVREALIAWRWLKPIAYDEFPADAPEPLKDRGGPLYASWRHGEAAPANLAIREEPWSQLDAEPHLPRLLPKNVKARFCSVPLMLIGGPAVGKTSFLRALSHHLNCGRGQLHEGMYLESSDLELWNRMEAKPALGINKTTSETAGYNALVRDERDPEVARWMRLRFTDCKGEEINRRTLTPELLRNLRVARGLIFFVDDRSFPDLLSDDRVASLAAGDFKDAGEIAAQYTRILQWYFDSNRDALHLPVALVVNKADLLLGPANLLSLNPSSLIPEQTKMELVHAGLRLPSEPAEPFDRLRACIRHNPAINRNIHNQRFVFELIERFKGFIAAAMCHTYRFQIFLTASVAQIKEDCEWLPHGVWDVTKWVVNQLEPAYRAQVIESVKRAHAELEDIKNKLGTAISRDHESHRAFLKAVTYRERVATLTSTQVLDRLLKKRIEHTSEGMRTALRDALSLAELPIIPDTTDPAPFLLQRRMAKEALERLEDQIGYLREWEDRHSGLHTAIPVRPSKKDAISVHDHSVSVRRAS